MNEDVKRQIAALLEDADAIGEEISADVEEILGVVPFIFPILRERSESFVLSTLGDFFIARPEGLDERTAELVCIAAAAAMGADSCLKVHMSAAQKAGVTRDEILDTLLIVALLGKTKILASSLRTFKRMFDEEDG